MYFEGERGYLALLSKILDEGEGRDDRTGVGTISLFTPPTLVFYNVAGGFPLLTTKKMAWKSIVAETLWFAQGRYDLESLREDGCKWWDDWEKADSTLGPVYGKQLRHWTRPDGTEVDQLAKVIREIEDNPTSRRLVLTMWNPGELEDMALPPCHGALIQFYVGSEGLSLHVNIRSSDVFLGLPTNIAGYALLLEMVANQVGLLTADLYVTLGDAHIYKNHVEAVRTQLEREPGSFPSISLPAGKPVDSLKVEDIELHNYLSQGKIYAPIAV